MEKLRFEKDNLVGQGQRLMRGSSEVRANDIEYKVSKLDDRWNKLQAQQQARYNIINFERKFCKS